MQHGGHDEEEEEEEEEAHGGHGHSHGGAECHGVSTKRFVVVF